MAIRRGEIIKDIKRRRESCESREGLMRLTLLHHAGQYRAVIMLLCKRIRSGFQYKVGDVAW